MGSHGYKATLEEGRSAVAREAECCVVWLRDPGGRRVGTAAAIREMAVEHESFARLRAATGSTMGLARVAMLKEEVDKLEARERVAALVWGVGGGGEEIREQGLGVETERLNEEAWRMISFYGRLKYGVVDGLLILRTLRICIRFLNTIRAD